MAQQDDGDGPYEVQFRLRDMPSVTTPQPVLKSLMIDLSKTRNRKNYQKECFSNVHYYPNLFRIEVASNLRRQQHNRLIATSSSRKKHYLRWNHLWDQVTDKGVIITDLQLDLQTTTFLMGKVVDTLETNNAITMLSVEFSVDLQISVSYLRKFKG